MSATATAGPFCGAHGCRDRAAVAIAHPTHGELVVCRACAGDHEVIRRV